MIRMSRFLRPSSEQGALVVFMAILMSTILSIGALYMAVSYSGMGVQSLQLAADEAAMAAAGTLSWDQQTPDYDVSRGKAMDVASGHGSAAFPISLEANYSNSVDGDIVLGTWDPSTEEFTASLSGPNAVRVTAHRTDEAADGPASSPLGGIFGDGQLHLARSAIAYSEPGESSLPGLLVLHPTKANALDMKDCELTVLDSGIWVNSTNSCAIKVRNNDVLVTSPYTHVVGGVCDSGGGGTFNPPPITGMDSLEDPFASLPEPSTAGMTDYDRMKDNGTYLPGYYPRGIDLKNETAILLPGLYYIGCGGGSKGIKLQGSSILRGTGGVCLFMGPGNKSIDTKGESYLDLVAPDDGTYAGICIFQSRSNSKENKIRGVNPGSGDDDDDDDDDGGAIPGNEIDGVIYTPKARIKPYQWALMTCGPIVTEQLKPQGDARVTIQASGTTQSASTILLVR